MQRVDCIIYLPKMPNLWLDTLWPRQNTSITIFSTTTDQIIKLTLCLQMRRLNEHFDVNKLQIV